MPAVDHLDLAAALTVEDLKILRQQTGIGTIADNLACHFYRQQYRFTLIDLIAIEIRFGRLGASRDVEKNTGEQQKRAPTG
jgi:hypothetical protein